MSGRSQDVQTRVKRKQRSTAEIYHRQQNVARRTQESETTNREAGKEAWRNFFVRNDRGAAHNNAVADAPALVPTAGSRLVTMKVAQSGRATHH